MMRILHYMYDPQTSGAAKIALRLIIATAKQMEATLAVSVTQPEEFCQQLASLGVRVLVMNDDIDATLSRVHSDVLHIHGCWSSSAAKVQKVARKGNIINCVSVYGGMSPEVLNVDFTKKRLLPLVSYQWSMVRLCSSVIAITKKEEADLVTIKCTKRIDAVIDSVVGKDWSDQDMQELGDTLLRLYRKSSDTFYKKLMTAEEKSLVDRIVKEEFSMTISPQTGDSKTVANEAAVLTPMLLSPEAIRRMAFYAYDEDVSQLFADGLRRRIKDIGGDSCDIDSVDLCVRYRLKNTKVRGSINEQELPKINNYKNNLSPVDQNAFESIVKATRKGWNNLTLRQKMEMVRLFVLVDFDECIVGRMLKKANLKKSTIKLQKHLSAEFDLAPGYYIF